MVIFIGILVALIIKSDIIKELINVKAPCYAHVSQGHSRRKGNSAAISQASSLGNTELIMMLMPPGCYQCAAVLLSKQHLLYWFNQTHVPLFYSGAVWLHVKKEELGFGLSPSQPNTWSLAAILRCVGTMEAMCHGAGCAGAGQWLFIPASSGTGAMMVQSCKCMLLPKSSIFPVFQGLRNRLS